MIDIMTLTRVVNLGGLIVGFFLVLFFLWGIWEIKNAPDMEECNLCGIAEYPEKIKHMKKEKHSPIAVCPGCVGRAKAEGFEFY